MLIVTGATGHLGSLIVDRLLERVPTGRIGVSVRDVSKAAELAERGVRVRAGDFTEPDSLKHAFEGAERVLVVSAAIRGGGASTANNAAIDAAREAGAQHILYTSHQAASPLSLFPPQKVHAATEEHLKQQGVPYTALRNGFYASTLGYYIGAALKTGTLAVPQDGPVSWTAHEDLAEAAAFALTEDGGLEGVTPPLTAPTRSTSPTLPTSSAASPAGPSPGSSWTTTSGYPQQSPHGMPRPHCGVLPDDVRRIAQGGVRRRQPDTGSHHRPPREDRPRGLGGLLALPVNRPALVRGTDAGARTTRSPLARRPPPGRRCLRRPSGTEATDPSGPRDHQPGEPVRSRHQLPLTSSPGPAPRPRLLRLQVPLSFDPQGRPVRRCFRCTSVFRHSGGRTHPGAAPAHRYAPAVYKRGAPR